MRPVRGHDGAERRRCGFEPGQRWAAGIRSPRQQRPLGPGEGELNLVIWAGYAEDGSTYPEYDWVTPFEDATGCQVNAKVQADSANGVQLLQSGEYDGGAFSGNATDRLMAGGDVAPVNVDLLQNYAKVFEGLKNKPHNSLDGVPYGVPHGRGPNLLIWNTEEVDEQTTWNGLWEDSAQYAGKLSIFDSPDFIADASLHLMATQPELGITNPYQLTQAQFDAAIDLLETLEPRARQYWNGVTFGEQITAFASGDVTIGTTWQYHGQRPAERERAGQGHQARRGRDGLVRHLDDLQPGEEPELHVHVDGPHDVGRGQRHGHRVLRRGVDERGGLCVRGDALARPLRADPRAGRAVLGGRLVLVDRARGLRRHRRSHDLRHDQDAWVEAWTTLRGG